MILCLHSKRGFPQHGKERCLQCGAVRDYIIGEDPGPWRKAEPAAETPKTEVVTNKC